MTNPAGVSDGVMQAEKAVCVASLNVSAEYVRQAGLEPWDFYIPECGEVWAEALHMESPSAIVLAVQRPDLIVAYQTWWGLYMPFANQGSLLAHAALVRRDSERRKALREQGRIVQAINKAGGVNRAISLEYTDGS